ncbi:MAG: cytochrome c oxidase accessory protein CcoG [Schleiferiaceae bacterium]|nr:cytochrome c oxidase accessory protein CcoG [Schleiferiaceae bacterium]
MSSIKELYQDHESFRDSIGTINEDGKRNFLYPKKPKGDFTKYRTYVSWVLLAILFAGPHIKIGGQPFLMFNVLERKFSILGQVFWPQDFHLLVLALITGVVFVILFTVVFGRIFCGWICPQTIFLEQVFRKIEYWIDGDRNQQLRLARMPWNAEKIGKRALKHTIFFTVSFAIANTFLMYLVGNDKWWAMVTDGPLAHLGNFVALVIFTGIFFFVFAWFREQACIVVCPYGRLQGVLLDRNSVVVAYDYKRGETRSKFKKSEDRAAAGKGDCIDCFQCVDVCPTGIDIRNGTQLECVNCTACIDACDEVMVKTNKPKGLIRYASENQIADGQKPSWTPRTIAYTAVLTVLLGVMTLLIFSRSEVEAMVLRVPGQTYQKLDNDIVANLFNFKMVNKTNNEMDLEIRVISPSSGEVEFAGTPDLHAKVGEFAQGTMFVKLPKSELTGSKTRVTIGVYSDGRLVEKMKTNFMGPLK